MGILLHKSSKLILALLLLTSCQKKQSIGIAILMDGNNRNQIEVFSDNTWRYTQGRSQSLLFGNAFDNEEKRARVYSEFHYMAGDFTMSKYRFFLEMKNKKSLKKAHRAISAKYEDIGSLGDFKGYMLLTQDELDKERAVSLYEFAKYNDVVQSNTWEVFMLIITSTHDYDYWHNKLKEWPDLGDPDEFKSYILSVAKRHNILAGELNSIGAHDTGDKMEDDIYNYFAKTGYKGSREEFNEKMKDPANREKVYRRLSSQGYKGLGSFEDFNRDMGYGDNWRAR